MPANLQAAIRAIRAGFAVFPTRNRGKEPHRNVNPRPFDAEGIPRPFTARDGRKVPYVDVVPEWLRATWPATDNSPPSAKGGFHQATEDERMAADVLWAAEGGGWLDAPAGQAVPLGAAVIDEDDGFEPAISEKLATACTQIVRSPNGKHYYFREPSPPLPQGPMYLDRPDPQKPHQRLHAACVKGACKGYTLAPGSRIAAGEYVLETGAPFTADPALLTEIPPEVLPELRTMRARSRSLRHAVVSGRLSKKKSTASKKARREEEARAKREGRPPCAVPEIYVPLSDAELLEALPDMEHGEGRNEILLSFTARLAARGKLEAAEDAILAATANWCSPNRSDYPAAVRAMIASAKAKFQPPVVRRVVGDLSKKVGPPSDEGNRKAALDALAHLITRCGLAEDEARSAWFAWCSLLIGVPREAVADEWAGRPKESDSPGALAGAAYWLRSRQEREERRAKREPVSFTMPDGVPQPPPDAPPHPPPPPPPPGDEGVDDPRAPDGPDDGPPDASEDDEPDGADDWQPPPAGTTPLVRQSGDVSLSPAEAASIDATLAGFPPWLTAPSLDPGSKTHLAKGLLLEFACEAALVKPEKAEKRGGKAAAGRSRFLLMANRAGVWDQDLDRAGRQIRDCVELHTQELTRYAHGKMRAARDTDDKEQKAIARSLMRTAKYVNSRAHAVDGPAIAEAAGESGTSLTPFSLLAPHEMLASTLRRRGVSFLWEHDLDADRACIGAQNGVVDIRTGRLLPRGEGRTKYVTTSVPHDYRPYAAHSAEARADVETLTEFLASDVARYVWDCLAFMLFGSPKRTLFFVVGETGSAKSTLLYALKAALGPYCGEIMGAAVDKAAKPASAGLSPEMEVFASPHRIAYSDEIGVRLNIKSLKRLSGEGTVTYRDLYQGLRTRAATASMIYVSNPQSMPKLGLSEPAMRDRYREIPAQVVPDDRKDADYIVRIQKPDRAAAVFARIVEVATALPSYTEPPSMPKEVERASKLRVETDASDLDQLLALIRPKRGAVLSQDALWDAWLEINDGERDGDEVGGFTRRKLMAALKRAHGSLGKARRATIDGRKSTVWDNFTLGDSEPEPERDADEPPPPDAGNPEPEPAAGAAHAGPGCRTCGRLFIYDPAEPDRKECFDCAPRKEPAPEREPPPEEDYLEPDGEIRDPPGADRRLKDG